MLTGILTESLLDEITIDPLYPSGGAWEALISKLTIFSVFYPSLGYLLMA
jgi:hypothetical protein